MREQRFVLGRRLGSGGMGSVFVATDTRFNRPVALKTMSRHLAPSAEFRERFLREADVLTRLSSPHVTTIYDHGEDDGSLWIATQLVTGGDLGKLLRERGPLPPHLALRVCGQVAEALRATHEVGVLHRDVKPANVLLRDPDAAQLHAYLCDFGIAESGAERLTVAGGVAGTWQYLAPERADGSPATPATDVYAVGCLLWACLTGRPPYTGSDVDIAVGHLEGTIPQVPGRGPGTVELNAVLRTALAKDPRERFQTAAELRDALAGAEAALPVSLPPLTLRDPGPAPLSPSGQQVPRRRRLVAGCVAGLVLVAGGIGLAVALTGDSDTGPGPGSAPAEPTTPAVTGDVDGDGRGDVVTHDWDGDAHRVAVLTSDGSGLAAAEQLTSTEYGGVLRGDLAGDGTEEVVIVDGDGGDLAVTAQSVGGEEESFTVSSGDFPGYGGEGTVLADVTGDGRDDLVLAPPNHGTGDPFEIWVARNTGDGFDELVSTHSSDDPVAVVMPADVDADGDEDLVLADPQGQRLTVLEAEDGELTTTGPASVNTVVYKPLVGDVDGDGSDEIVVADLISSTITVLGRSADGWDTDVWFSEDVDALALTMTSPMATVSDVDGDGDDDLVAFTDGEGADPRKVFVFASSGTDFAAPEEWGSYTCECQDYFDTVQPFETL